MKNGAPFCLKRARSELKQGGGWRKKEQELGTKKMARNHPIFFTLELAFVQLSHFRKGGLCGWLEYWPTLRR